MIAALLTLALAGAQAGAPGDASRAGSSCTVCHGKEARELSEGLHARAGLSCTSCHGGVEGTLDQAQAHGPDLRPLSGRREAVASCGTCHANVAEMRSFGLRTDQLSLYGVSAHGLALQADAGAEVATCATCHGAHRVLATSDSRSPVHDSRQVETCGACHADAALAARHDMDPAVVESYRGSVHGRALLERGLSSSPGCTDCHGSHGAAPPRLIEVGPVCGQCHAVVQQHFEQSPHFAAALRGEMEECTICHGDHGVVRPTPDMLLAGAGTSCAACHGEPDDPALAIAAALHADLHALDESIAATERLLAEAGARGLFIEEESGYLDDARSLRLRARAASHALSRSALDDLMNRGQAMAQETRERIASKDRELRDRRIFSAVFFGVALAFAGVLQVYRRTIRGSWDGPRRSGAQP